MVLCISEGGRDAGISFTGVKLMNGWWWIYVVGVTLSYKVISRNVIEPKYTDENWKKFMKFERGYWNWRFVTVIIEPEKLFILIETD